MKTGEMLWTLNAGVWAAIAYIHMEDGSLSLLAMTVIALACINIIMEVAVWSRRRRDNDRYPLK